MFQTRLCVHRPMILCPVCPVCAKERAFTYYAGGLCLLKKAWLLHLLYPGEKLRIDFKHGNWGQSLGPMIFQDMSHRSLQSVGLAPYPHGPLQPSPVAFSIVAWRYPHTVALKLSAAKKLLLVLGRKTAQFEKSKHHLHQMWPSECDADLQPQPIARCAKIEPTT